MQTSRKTFAWTVQYHKLLRVAKRFVNSSEGGSRPINEVSSKQSGKKQPKSRTKLPKAHSSHREKVLLQLLNVLQKKDYNEYYKGSWLCTAYSTGESYNLEGLENYFTTLGRSYHIAAMPKDALDVLHVSRVLEDGTEGGEVFFFRRLGAFVCWNIPGKERLDIRDVVKHFQIGPYSNDLIERENEQLSYNYTDSVTDLVSGNITIKETSTDEMKALEKYAFSNALALSVKLAIWESALDDFVDSLQNIPEILKRGMKLNMSTSQVLQKTGELLSLRHQINLYSDLLMTPDFYWDRENLEFLYNKTCNYLDVGRRTKVTNEKLNMCSEMVELLRSHLHEKHSIRLELGIIALIAIEVLFEIGHYIERLF